MKKLIVLLFLPLISFAVSAQLLVDGNHTAEEIVEILVGEGLTVDWATVDMNCPQNAYGSFNGSLTNLGIDEGIIMTSGEIANAVGPNSGGGVGSANGGAINDPELNDLSGVGTFDVCNLIFDFVPQGDTLTFSYVFGSEEYDDYVCSGVNDSFGFFIRGGTEYPSYTNLAILPGTLSTPVSINTVNGGTANGGDPDCDLTNDEFYVSNSSLTTTTIEYDGFTTVLLAGCAVTPCEPYTFKIAIADGGDSVWDSGVFIQENSFSTNGVQLSASTSFPADYDNAIEGCVDGVFTFTFEEPVTDTTVVYFDLLGTAQNGGPEADYEVLVDSLIVLPGDSTTSLIIPTFDDDMDEGPESLILKLRNEGCADLSLDSVQIYILESIVISATPESLVSCPGEPIQLEASGAGLYTWDPATYLDNQFLFNPVASPTESIEYTVTGSIGPCEAEATVNINMDDDYQPFIEPVHNICEGGSVQMQVQGGSFYFWCVWDDVFDDWNCADLPDNLSCSDCPDPVFSDGYEEEFAVIVIDGVAGCRDTIATSVIVADGDFLTVTPSDTTVCEGTPVQINALGGVTYQWLPTDGLSCTDCPNPIATPSTTTSYQLISQAGTCEDSISVEIVVEPFNFTLEDDMIVCEAIDTKIGPAATEGYSYQWSPTDGLSDPTISQPILSLAADNGDINTNYSLQITSDAGCIASDEINVFVSALPTLFINAPDTIIQGSVATLTGAGISGNGDYQWSGGQGDLTTLAGEVTSARPLLTTEYMLTGTNEYGCSSETTHTVHVVLPPRFLVPSAFSPNGDGVNDILRAITYDVKSLEQFVIYDRWGQLLYENPGDLSQGWDGSFNGEAMPIGVYVYFAEFIPNGSDEIYQAKGNFTIIK